MKLWLISKWFSWPNTPAASWYYDGPFVGRWYGNLWFHFLAAVIYFLVSVVLPLIGVCCGGSPRKAVEWLFYWPPAGFIWLAFTTLSLPLFIWGERLKFDTWVSTRPKRFQEKLTSRFELNTKNMEVFWKAVAGLYLTAGLFSFAGIGERTQPSQQPSKKDIVALTKAINSLGAAVAKAGKSKKEPTSSGTVDANKASPDDAKK